MFNLLQSIWMFSAAGVIVPLLIHIWNRKQGKTLKVGSISLLTESYKQQAKNIQLKDRLLLLLRCFLVLLIAFLLSGPAWVKQIDAAKEKGWVVMEKKDLQETYTRFKPLIDSLVAQKYEFHYFDDQFKKAELAEALKEKNDSVTNDSYSYWTMLSSLDQQVPATLPVYLFTTNGLKSFTGKRPELSMKLQWYTYTPKDSVTEWLAKAYIIGRDSVRLVTAKSSPSGTSYSYRSAPFTGISLPQNIAGDLPVSYPGNGQVTVDTSTLKLSIYTDKYAKDAAYVKAALDAIRQYTRRKISISLLNRSADIPSGEDWLFWLSDQPIVSSGAKNVFNYKNGKAVNTSSFIEAVSGGNGDEYLPLNKRVPFEAPARNSKTIWQDGFGKPLLALERGEVSSYHFYSHFDPAWNDLTWHSAFPRLMYNLLYETGEEMMVDNRMMDDQQALPVFSSAPLATEKEKFTDKYDLSQAFWLAALLVFFLERFISFRTKMQKANA